MLKVSNNLNRHYCEKPFPSSPRVQSWPLSGKSSRPLSAIATACCRTEISSDLDIGDEETGEPPSRKGSSDRIELDARKVADDRENLGLDEFAGECTLPEGTVLSSLFFIVAKYVSAKFQPVLCSLQFYDGLQQECIFLVEGSSKVSTLRMSHAEADRRGIMRRLR